MLMILMKIYYVCFDQEIFFIFFNYKSMLENKLFFLYVNDNGID